MLKKKLILAGTVLFIFGLTSYSFAQMRCAGHSNGGHKHSSQATQSGQRDTIVVGNKICPVLNEKIDEKNKATYEYQGKVYSFCCPACIGEFKKDPQRYIKKIEEESQVKTKTQSNAKNKVYIIPQSSPNKHENHQR